MPQQPSNMVVYNNALYFTAHDVDGLYGTELWKYDGTTVQMLYDFRTGSGSSSPACLTVYNGVLYFNAQNGSGRYLWEYDGSDFSIASSAPGGGDYFNLWDARLTEYDGDLYFTSGGNQYLPGTYLFMFDGTYTYYVARRMLTSMTQVFEQFGSFDGHFYYVGEDHQLWQWQ